MLAGEDIACAAHVRRELIDLVEPRVDHRAGELRVSQIAETKSSASVSACSWNLISTPRTQKSSRLSRLTRCPPINPPAPHTNAVFMLLSSIGPLDCQRSCALLALQRLQLLAQSG